MSEPEKYVATRDLKAALEGRETDILDALNIDWRKCSKSNHLRCPYPSHGGDGLNWRWDTKQRKAHCTCQDGHADNVLDVLLKCEGLDIEAGKLRAAEILGRPDLVREKGGKGQKTDPASLLSPPAALQAPDLPRGYLASRLGIEPADVLRGGSPRRGRPSRRSTAPAGSRGSTRSTRRRSESTAACWTPSRSCARSSKRGGRSTGAGPRCSTGWCGSAGRAGTGRFEVIINHPKSASALENNAPEQLTPALFRRHLHGLKPELRHVPQG